MRLTDLYAPISGEMRKVDGIISSTVRKTDSAIILNIMKFILSTTGKRIRPALVLFSAMATESPTRMNSGPQKSSNDELVEIAASMELIHMASLIHDDIIDHANFRHNKPTMNKLWGPDTSIALGDYLYSKAFELIATSGNNRILACVSRATSQMCEGELVQVVERDNLSLMRKQYLSIIQKKTAALLSASCESGAIFSGCDQKLQDSLGRFGLDFGMAFQIIDDCMDLVADRKELGKLPGADFFAGEFTLPVLNLLERSRDRKKVVSLLKHRRNKGVFIELRKRFLGSEAYEMTRNEIQHYVGKAEKNLSQLRDSAYKDNLLGLTHRIVERLNSVPL